MTDVPASPEPNSPPDLSTLNNNELAVLRTQLAQDRTEMASQRTEKSMLRTDLAGSRTDLAEVRTDLARDRNRMAAERTLMAWIRTSLSLISFGFGIDRFFAYLNKAQESAAVNVLTEERLLGLSFITLGTFGLIAAIVTHWQTLKNIEQNKYTYIPKWSLGLVVAIVLVFIGLATYLPLITADVKLRDIITPDSQIIQNFVGLTIFLIMLTMGLNYSLRELVAFWKQPSLVLRSQLAISLFFPAITVVFLWLFQPPTAVIVGLAILAATPGAPLLTRRVEMAGGSASYGASLQVTLSLSAVLITPLLLGLFGQLFPVDIAAVDSFQIAKQIAVVQLLPLGIGLGLRQIGTETANEISDFLTVTANTLFVVLAILLLIVSLDLIPSIGASSIILIVLITASALVVGHFLGGPTPETQAAVSIACIARNVGLAIFIAILNNQTRAIPVILSYLILAALVGFLYSAWVKPKVALSSSPTS